MFQLRKDMIWYSSDNT